MKVLFVLLLICWCASASILTSSDKVMTQTCLDVVQNWQQIPHTQQQGLYRFAHEQDPIIIPNNADVPFRDYLAQTKSLIANRNIRARQPCPILTPVAKELGYNAEQLTVSDLIAPFELKQNNQKRAILLIHGLTDSPFTFHYLAKDLFQQGYSVRTLLLPGHATAPSDLQYVTLKDWQDTVEYAITRTAKDFEQFAILGYSTGAALAIAHVAQHAPSNLKGLALISPASEPHNKHGWLAKWIAKIPFFNWVDKDADLDFAKYESFPWQAAALANDAMAELKLHSLPAHLPLFSAFSEVDTTIDSIANLAMLSRFNSVSKQPQTHILYYYGNANNATAKLPKDYTLITPQCTHHTCDKVIDMSHIGILQPASHPYYGWQGLYRSCSGYLSDIPKYLACKQHPAPLLGERTEQNTRHTAPLQRLTFNPAYDDFTRQLSTFLNSTMSNYVQP